MDRRRLLLIGLAVCVALVLAGFGLSLFDQRARDRTDGLSPIRQRTQQVARIMKKDSPARMSGKAFSERVWTLIRDGGSLRIEKTANAGASDVFVYALSERRPEGYEVVYWFQSTSPGFGRQEKDGGLDRTTLCGENLRVTWAAIYRTEDDPQPAIKTAWRAYQMAELTGETVTSEPSQAARSAAEKSRKQASEYRLDGDRTIKLPCTSRGPLVGDRPIQILRARTAQIRQMMATDRNPDRLSEAAYSELFWRLFGRGDVPAERVKDTEGLYRYELFDQDANGLQVRMYFLASTPDFRRPSFQGGLDRRRLCGQVLRTEWALNYDAMNDNAPKVMGALKRVRYPALSSPTVNSSDLSIAASDQFERDTEAELKGTRSFTVQCPERRR